MSAKQCSEDDDEDILDNKDEIYYPLTKPDGPITGAIWRNGKWLHVNNKRQTFDDETLDQFHQHSNLLINPKKRARFHMKIEQSEIEILSKRIKLEKPPRNLNPIALLQASEIKNKYKNQLKYNLTSNTPTPEYPKNYKSALNILSLTGNFQISETFDELPISQYTKYSLASKGYKYLTDIQKAAIPHALTGRDILGAAKTGSGKTLAYLIPVLENLYRKSWTSTLGLGALIIVPTRELAFQIYSCIHIFRKRLKHITYGLIIGGKHSRMIDEKSTIGKLSIIVCTPGRILNHFESASRIIAQSLQILVIDEADLMLDMGGLMHQVRKIMDYLPIKRQTLLFSATLTMDIIKLAKISLRKPVFLPVNTADVYALPENLIQTYVETPIEHKYNLLWSFIQTHIEHKIIVFFATLRMVKYTRRMFLKLRPYSCVVTLHSEMRQIKRLEMYRLFKRKRRRCMLLCTEIASRGLDFQNIDFVINFDVPLDVKSYIHRVGRTARIGQSGNSITFLTNAELGFVGELKKKANIVVKKLGIHAKNMQPILGSFRTVIAQDQRMAELAAKAFKSYLAYYYFHGNREYMDVKMLDKEKLAYMFGLMYVPKYKKFLRKLKKRRKVSKLDDMPRELKELLLDTKKKRIEKQLCIKAIAESNALLMDEKKESGIIDDGSDDGVKDVVVDEDIDVKHWLDDESEDDDENEDFDIDNSGDDENDLEKFALQAIQNRN